MMGEVSENDRRALLQCVMAVVRSDVDMITKSLQELGIVSQSASLDSVNKTIAPFIEYYRGRDIMQLDFDDIEEEVDTIIAERSFRLPPNLAYLLRAGSSLEGIARTLQPDFSFVNAVRPVMTKWALQQGIESLAKSGRLREFAEFAWREWRASREDGKESKEKEPDRKLLKSAQEANLPVVTQAVTIAKPAKCEQCAQHKSDIRALAANVRLVSFLGIAYILLSIGLSVISVRSSSYGHDSLYFLIGNSVLGAIIFWRLIGLLKWISRYSAEVQKSRDDGDKRC
jgi:predicted unusual protein kinase regulating ubiquinone biosynthesis (AarF/ABC1/UbiB family)